MRLKPLLRCEVAQRYQRVVGYESLTVKLTARCSLMTEFFNLKGTLDAALSLSLRGEMTSLRRN